MSDPFPLICIVGATASGKTDCICQLPPDTIEIINADSMQVYCGMDIGTAKPSQVLRQSIRHHLLDIMLPNQQYHVAEFVRQCDELIPAIHARGRMPVLVGGTAFYVYCLLYGLPQTPPPSAEIRSALRQELEERGGEAMHAELSAIDALSAGRIHPADNHRVLRALEVYRSTGRPLSSFPHPDKLRSCYKTSLVGISRARDILRQRIEKRSYRMFEEGLAKEVRNLMDQGYVAQDPGMRAIGYREFWQYHEQYGLSIFTDTIILNKIRKRIVGNSVQYAKRQTLFFSRLKEITWFDSGEVLDFVRSLLC